MSRRLCLDINENEIDYEDNREETHNYSLDENNQSYEERIINALKTIQQVCRDNVDKGNVGCKKCPLSIEIGHHIYECGITNLQPDNWKILDYKGFKALG